VGNDKRSFSLRSQNDSKRAVIILAYLCFRCAFLTRMKSAYSVIENDEQSQVLGIFST